MRKKRVKADTRITSFVCPVLLAERLARLAARERRSRSQQIVLMLERAIDEAEKETSE